MSKLANILGVDDTPNPLRDAFLRWQCRVRQMGMRDGEGRPDDGVMPAVTPLGSTEPSGHIITVLCKSPAHSLVPEFKQMYKRTFDPAERRKKALELFSETYYQKYEQFSDILTATFPPESEGAVALRKAERCRLDFHAYGQSFSLDCKVWKLAPKNPLHQATFWHNLLFNPNLNPDTVILGFEPDWSKSTADPGVPQS